MAIDLLNRLTGQVNKVQTKEVTVVANADQAEVAKVLRSVYALKSGDTLQGELLSAKGTDLTLLLGNAVVLNAKTDKNLLLQPGQMMNFTVSSNHSGKLSLKPLFTNTGLEQNAMKALDAAGVLVTEKSLALAEEMMKQGLPIDKQSLQTMIRQMNAFPDAEIHDLVMLQKMNLPVTEQNIQMMHLYQSNQQYLFEDMQGLAQEMSSFITDTIQGNGNNQSVVEPFVQALIHIFSSNQNVNQLPEMESRGQQVQDPLIQEQAFVPENEAGEEKPANAIQIIREDVSNQLGTNRMELQKNPLESELERILLSKEFDKGAQKQELTHTLLSLLKDQFLMKPEMIKDADSVKQFYEKLQLQIEQLEHLIKSTGKEESSLGKNITTVKNNIQFMNQINEMYHYVQLPLKMNQETASGDLYVYKRKNSKTGEDGKLTALLHLSMPTLGNMDVFLSLQDQRLSTRFCMENEELVDFMEAHMDLLNDKLAKKGYLIQTSVAMNTQEEKTVIDHIMKTENKIPVFSDTSFDARC